MTGVKLSATVAVCVEQKNKESVGNIIYYIKLISGVFFLSFNKQKNNLLIGC